MRTSLFLVAVPLLFHCLCQSVFAVSITLTAPAQISDQEFTVEATVLGASPGQNYLRVDLYRDQTSNYFGQTFNGSDWVDSSDGKSFAPITIASNQAHLSIQARVGDPSSGEYAGSGIYKLRVRRYTASGSFASNDTFEPLNIQINYSPPTPTSQDPSPTPTQVKMPTALPTIKPSLVKSVLVTQAIQDENEDKTGHEGVYPTAVLGVHEKARKLVIPTKILVASNVNKRDFIPLIFFAFGGIFVAICGILMYRNWSKRL